MIITRLILKNFGRHRNLDIRPHAHVVGMLGENDAGKSTVLEAVQFAITGETPYDQDSYVTYGEDNGSVELTFIRHGQTGTIFRQVGKTPKRTLVWEDKTIKAAKEVDEIMASILGADKKAVSAAVFIPQGDLQNLLFGKQSDREVLFIRLVNLAFCEQTAKILDGKIKKVSSTVLDLTTVIDEARVVLQQTDSALAAARTGLADLHDLQNVLNRGQQRANVKAQKETAQHQHRDACQRKNEKASALTALLTTRGFVEPGAVRAQIGILNNLRLPIVKDIDRITNDIAKLERLNTLAQQFNEASEAVSQLTAKHGAAVTLLPPDPNSAVAELQKLSREGAEYQQFANSVDSFVQEIARQTHELSLVVVPDHSARLEVLGREVMTQRTLLDQNRRWLASQEQIQKCSSKADAEGKCKDCGLRLAPQQDFDPALMDTLRAGIKTTEADISAKALESSRLLGEQNGALTRQTDLKRSVEFLSQQLAQQRENLNKVPHAKYVDVESVNRQIRELTDRIRDLANMADELEKGKQRRDKIGKDIADVGMVDSSQVSQELLTRARSQRDTIDAQIRDLTAFDQDVTKLATDLRIVETQLQTIDEQIETCDNTLAGLPLDVEEANLLTRFDGKLDLVQAELQARHDRWLQQNGMVIEAQRANMAAQVRIKELEERANQDSKRRSCLNRLQELKALMSRQGLPGKYVAHRFTQLAMLTQAHLTKMVSRFDVYIDPEIPLSFRFKRRDDGADLPMTKLSGGQRVRLSLAFLMAVQEALVPDVGLLVLDEPSMHLDLAGKASLAELLTEAGQRLSVGESQIWVSDHAIELEPSFGVTVRL